MTGGEVIQALGFAKTVVNKVVSVIKRDRDLKAELKSGLKDIELEMRMVISDIDSNEKKNQGATHESKIALLKELACDIEDFLDLTCLPGKSCQFILSALGMDPRHQKLKSIDNFKDRIKKVRDWQPGGATWSGLSVSAPSAHPYSQEATCFKNRCRHTIIELEMLLSAAEEQELKVISIVGCRGVGKTTLARAVYDHCRALLCGYDCVAWVVASECRDPEHLVTKVLEEAKTTCRAAEGSISDSDTEQTSSLGNFLRDKRYFVVIDDVDRPEVWQAIKHEFPEEGRGSRIIVTTSAHSVAAECSGASYYVYPMQCLEKDESEQVFMETVGEENRSSPAVQRASEGIIKKCGGLPLALVSVADYLRRRGRVAGGLTADHCKSAARALGDKILRGQDAEFSKINRALTQCYDDLPDYAHRSCLLYASVLPRGRPINSKVLLRRWMTEELAAAQNSDDGSASIVADVDKEEGAKGCLEGLVDRCIIEPVEIKDARLARCRVHSIMLEFVIRKAVSKNFVALVDKDELLSCNDGCVRRLSVQDSSKEGVDTATAERGIDWSVMRSLTIFGSPLLDLQKCKLLRVLDLEGCKGFLNDAAAVKAICEQRFLKYLSLRGTDVARLPPQIQHLEKLETLDIRDTGVRVVPVEVVSLPLLAHLLGRFELARGIKKKIAKQSRLQTLAGVVVVVTEADESFENMILHAGKLRKVKVYQAATSNTLSSSSSSSSSPLSRLKERFTGSKALQIVSIDSSSFSTEFISFLEAPCAIASIKLRGRLESLPHTRTLTELVGLNKLILISTGLSIEDLSALQCLYCLEYLKLAQEDAHGFRGGSFHVRSRGFPSLRRLCFEAPKLPQVRFEQGSMRSLTSLDLLCPGSYDVPDEPPFAMYFCSFYRQVCDPMETSSCCRLGVAGVSYLENLNEVILHHSTTESKVLAWKEEAIRHKNKPSVTRKPQPTIQ